MAAQQGILLPVSLQLTNLQDIVNLLKQFSGKNILSNSLGGKKIDKELLLVINRLEQISAKSKTALTSLSNFSSILRDIDAIEIGFNKILDVIKSISFEDLKLPNDVLAQVDGLNSRIKELLNSLISFKGTQKEKLLNNDAFKANLSTAMGGPAQAAKEMEKGYDLLYQSINNGLTKVNRVLGIRIAEFKDALNAFTLSSANKTMMTQWGAVDFLKEAFSSLPKDKSKKSDTQKLLSEIMEYKNLDVSGFKNKGLGYNKFMDLIQERFLLSDSQMADFLNKIRELAKALKKTLTEVLRDISLDSTKAASFLFGSLKNTILLGALKYNPQLYDNDKRTYETAKRDLLKTQEEKVAYSALRSSFGDTNKAVEAEASRIALALKLPLQELANLKLRAIEAALANPLLVNAFNGASLAVNLMGIEILNGEARLAKMNLTLGKMLGVQNFINRYIGVYAIVRKVTQFLRNAIENIKELDKSITNIAIVTNMSLQDLWGKVGQYTQMAQQYGVATKDVYNVSQLFYQLGLLTNLVMALTTETLKMAKVSGMDYTEATNAMTVAIRAFSIEMDNAQLVTDTYSALAAKFAVSSAEIANAMEKTASSAANVGMSLQSTSAFISVMEQTTREGAQNIGSALKSIISRYGEMKASPNTLLNIDGEEVAFNKVDTALKSVGISIKDSTGQFRDFDDVIMELAKKWDSLDNNTQRYVATVMAGNRQQSRFIALVSNYDELKRAVDTANNAENASVVLTAKAMDSLESKANQLKNAFSLLYLDLHFEDTLKGLYDWLTKLITLIGKLGPINGVVKTLFTVVNAGFGMRGLINMGKESYQSKMRDQLDEVNKLKLDKSEAEKSLNEFIQLVELPREMPIKMRVDTSELSIDTLNASSMFSGTLNSIAPGIDSTGSVEEIKTQVISSLSNIEGIKGQIEAVGSEVAQSLVIGMLNSIGITGPAAERLGQSILEGIQNSLDIHSPSPLIIAMLETGVGGAAVLAMILAAKEAGASSAEIGNLILLNLAQSINNKNISFEGLTEQLKTGLDNFAREASTYSHEQLLGMFGLDTFKAIQVASYRTHGERLDKQLAETHELWERTGDSDQAAYLQLLMDSLRTQRDNLTIDNAPILPSAIKDIGLTQLYDMLGGGLARNSNREFRNIIRDRDLTEKIKSQYGDKWTDATVASTVKTLLEEEKEAARKEEERKAKEEADRKAREEADRKAMEEAEKKAQEEARYKAELERLSREAMARVTANDRPSTAGTSSMNTIMNAVRNTPTVGPRDYNQFVGTVALSRTPNVLTSSLADLLAAVAQETAAEMAKAAEEARQAQRNEFLKNLEAFSEAIAGTKGETKITLETALNPEGAQKDILNIKEEGKTETVELASDILKYTAPELSNAGLSAWTTGENGAPLTLETLDQITSKLRELGDMADETALKLQDMYANAKAPEDYMNFVKEYNAATGALGTINEPTTPNGFFNPENLDEGARDVYEQQSGMVTIEFQADATKALQVRQLFIDETNHTEATTQIGANGTEAQREVQKIVDDINGQTAQIKIETVLDMLNAEGWVADKGLVASTLLTNSPGLDDTNYRLNVVLNSLGLNLNDANYAAIDNFVARLGELANTVGATAPEFDLLRAVAETERMAREENALVVRNSSESIRGNTQDMQGERDARALVTGALREEATNREARKILRTFDEWGNETTGQVDEDLKAWDAASGVSDYKSSMRARIGARAKKGLSWEGHGGKARAGVSLASNLVKMAAPAVIGLAADAGVKNMNDVKNRTTEDDKIITGIGLGLSGAATGAQMGMAFGPWGAAIGAIGGFLIGGISTILDGAEYTATEKYNDAKEISKKLQDDALKESAKVTELSSSIDNIKELLKTMNDSKESMDEYKNAMNQLGETYPDLIDGYDSEGRAIINLAEAESKLLEIRLNAADAAEVAAAADADLYELGAKVTEDASEQAYWLMMNSDAGYTSLMKNAALEIDKILAANKNNTELFGGYESIKDILHKDKTFDYSKLSSDEVEEIRKFINGRDSVISATAESKKEAKDRAEIKSEYTKGISNATNLSAAEKNDLISNESFALLYLVYKDISGGGNVSGKFAQEVMLKLTGTQRDKLKSVNYSAFRNANELIDYLGVYNYSDEFKASLQLLIDNERLAYLTDFENTFYERDSKGNFYYDEKGRPIVRKNLVGLNALNTDIMGADISAGDIEYLFENKGNGKPQLISEYETYFSNLMLEINRIAEDGLVSIASELMRLLYYLGVALLNLESTAQEALFGMITSIDFSDYDSIISEMENIKKYGEDNDIDVKPIINLLSEAANSLIFNMNTIIESAVDRAKSFSEEISSIVSANKNGLDYSKALEEFLKLLNELENGSELNFNDLFIFDPVLLKYIYNLEKLNEVIAAKEKELVIDREKGNRQIENELGLMEKLKEVKSSSVNAKSFNADTSTVKEVLSSTMQLVDDNGNITNANLFSLIGGSNALISGMLGPNQELLNRVRWLGLYLSEGGDSKDLATLLMDEYDIDYENVGYDTLNNWGNQIEEKAAEWKENNLTAFDYYNTILHGTNNDALFKLSLAEMIRLKAEESGLTIEDMNHLLSFIDEITANGERDLSVILLNSANILDDSYNQYKDIYSSLVNTEGVMNFTDTQEYTKLYWHATESDKQRFKEDTLNKVGKLDDEEEKLYNKLIDDFFADENLKDENYTMLYFFETWLVEREKAMDEDAALFRAIMDSRETDLKNQLFLMVDWTSLYGGTDITGRNLRNMKILASLLGLIDENGQWIQEIQDKMGESEEEAWKYVYDAFLVLQYGIEKTLDDGTKTYTMEEASEEKQRAYLAAWDAFIGEASTTVSLQASTAITELLGGAGTKLSNTTIALLQANDIDLDDNGVVAESEYLVASVADLYDKIKNSFSTVSEANKAYAAILTKKYEQSNLLISTLSSGASLDINSLESTFTAFGLNLSDFYETTNGFGDFHWGDQDSNRFSGVIETDQFGKTTIRDWNKFMEIIEEEAHVDFSSLKDTFEYQNAYSSYVDGMITLDTLFQDLIKKSYDNAFSSITLFKEMNVSLLSEDILDKLTKNGAATINNGILTVTNALEYATNAQEYFAELSLLSPKELYDLTGWSSADLAKNWKAAEVVLTQSKDSWTSIGLNIASVSADLISTLIEKGGLKVDDIGIGKIFEPVGDHYVISLQNYALLLAKASVVHGKINTEAYLKAMNAAQLAIFNNISGLDWTKVLDGTATNADLDTFKQGLVDNLTALGSSLGENYQEIIENVKSGELNVTELVNALAGVDEALANHIKETIAEVQNNILSSISTAGGYTFEGTNNVSDMLKFVDEYNKLVDGANISIQSAFGYDTNLNQFTLNEDILKNYIEALKAQLKQLGLSGKAIDEYIRDQTENLLRLNMNISDILNDSDRGARDKAINNLYKQLVQLATLTNVENAEKYATDRIKYFLLGNDRTLAVLELVNLKGKDTTKEEVQAIYSARVDALLEATEALEQGLGAILSGLAAQVASLTNDIETTPLADGSVVITAVHDMAEAYAILYNSMKEKTEATTASLNNLYAKFLTSIDLPEMDAISVLNDAMGMSYEALGEMLAGYGKSLEEAITNYKDWGLKSLGNGTVLIYDFDKFAKSMNWESDSDAYKEARKAYNLSLIELDKKIGLNLTEGIKSISELKVRDRFDISYLADILGEELYTVLARNSVGWKNGIALITEGTKVDKLVQDIATLAAQNSLLLPQELAELANTVSDYIKGIIDLIKNGISGSLNNVLALELQSWADQFNIKLDFTKTAEGLKISTNQAIQLYNKIKDIDKVLSKLLFDELNKSLKETNEHYKDISSIRLRIQELEENPSTATNDALREELALAKEILAVRSTSEDEGFNFMSNKIPGAQNNPLNYYSNWAKAILTLDTSLNKTSGKNKGLIDYQDWYNIVTEMNNLAKVGDGIKVGSVTLNGDLKTAGKLIEEGARYLTTNDAGEVKVDLKKIGVNFKTGSGEMSDGINAGIKAMADSQVKMLDGMIRLLEVIVAMEELGDITLGDNTINFEDFFKITGDTTAGLNTANENITKWVDGLLTLDDEESDLYKALDQIKINNQSLRELLLSAKEGTIDIKDAEALTSVLNSMWLMYQSGDWDLDNLYESLAQIAEESGFGGELTLNIDDTTLIISGGKITLIDWQDADTQAVLAEWKTMAGHTQESLIDAINKYNKGMALAPEDLVLVLKLLKILLVDDNNNVTVSINGETQTFPGLNDILKGRLAKWVALELAGIDIPDITIDLLNKTEAPSVKINQTGELEYQVLYDDENGILYKAMLEDGNPIVGSSIEELALAWINWAKTLPENQGKEYELDEVMWALFHQRVHIETIVTDEHDNPINGVLPESDLREKVKELLNNGDYSKAVLLDNGHYEFKIAGITMILDGASVETDGTLDMGKVVSEANKQLLGIDLGLSESITKGVADAVPTIVKELNNLNADGANAMATALHEMLDNLDKLKSVEFDTIAEGLRSLGIEIPDTTDVGTNVVDGIVEGMDQETGKISESTDNIADTTVEDAKESFVIESPSHIMMPTGLFVTAGIAEGMKQGSDEIAAAAAELVNAAIEGVTSTIQAYNASNGIQDNDTETKVTKSTSTGVNSGAIDFGAMESALSEISNSINLTSSDISSHGSQTVSAFDALTSSAIELNNTSIVSNILNLSESTTSLKTAMYWLDYWANEAKDHIHTLGEYSGQAEWPIKYLGNDAETTRAEVTKLGEEAKEAYGHISKFGELTGGAEKAFEPLSKYAATAAESLGKIKIDITGLEGDEKLQDGKLEISIDQDKVKKEAKEAKATIDGIKQSKPVLVSVTDGGTVAAIQSAIDGIQGRDNVIVEVYEHYHPDPKNPSGGALGDNEARGNVGAMVARAKGTLMGELGPELVVSNGRYFVAGLNGAEFVNLNSDAIVFNHLQTRSLLENGMSKTRGRAVTNERSAVAFARGNVAGGPAKASASAALNALKQLRAQWKALESMSVKDLAGKGGGGGGGDPKAFLKDLERWYNWLLLIAQLEKDINYQESLRNRIASDYNKDGLKYYQSQRKSLKDLTEEILTQKSLLSSQEDYFKTRLDELNKLSAFSALYGFSDSGQLYYRQGIYKDGKTAFEWLSDLAGRNSITGEANYTAKEQYDKLIAAGFGFAMEYDSSGNKIDTKAEGFENTAIQAFWDKIEADKSEMLSLHDSIEDLNNSIESNTQKQNEILKAIEDNQISVENRVLAAIEDSRQRAIEEQRKERDAIEKTNSDLIKGLSDALAKERELYNNSESDKELTSLQRQLSILRRSGGSAAEISSLQQEIASKQQDMYFDMQLQQIDALQEASDKQLERLDRLIELEEETLEYQKANGLLWDLVYEVMAGTPEEITLFIADNTSEYWSKSEVALGQEVRQVEFEAELWKAFSKEGDITTLLGSIEDEVTRDTKEKLAKEEAERAAAEAAAALTTSSGSGNNNNNNSGGGTHHYKYYDATYHWDVETDKHKHVFSGAITKGAKCKYCDFKAGEYRPQEYTPNEESQAKTLALINAKTKLNNKFKFWDTATYDTGGMIPEDQLALVHAKESVLTPEQTSILRNEILGSNRNSLMSLLLDFREAYTGLGESTYNSMNNSNNGVVIEHAEVNMRVDSLANGYDSARAADDVMKEMLNIARKTNAQNRVGR